MSSGRAGAEVPAGQEAVSLAASAERFAAGGLAGGWQLSGQVVSRRPVGDKSCSSGPTLSPRAVGCVDGENG